MLMKHRKITEKKAKSNSLQITELGTKKCYNSCSGNFNKIPWKKSVKLHFLKKLANKTLS